VIRKKLIKENAIIRLYFLHPAKIILGATPDADWMSANYRHSQLGVWR